ncbi:MAG: DsrE family protein [Bacteroidetes bacterium]|nr:DsrE family protein [Bacteroidota bacterium]
MKFLFLLTTSMFMLANAYSQQYNLYETTLTCDKSQKELVASGHEKIKLVLETMAREGKLLNFATNQQYKKDNISLTYTLAAENEARFKEIIGEWKRRTDLSYPEIFLNFWKGCPKRKDSIMNNVTVIYPVIKSLWSPVAVVEGIDELPDPKLEYNIVIDFTAFANSDENKSKMDSSSVNWGLSDVGRNFNLHVAAGIPNEKIHFVVAVHGFASRSFLTDDAYKKRYKINNPNLAIIEELSKAGVKFLVCGQSLIWMGDKKEMLTPQAKVSLTAQTTLSSYQLKGYALKSIKNDD